MKIRTGFVSNSSSASFTIKVKDLSDEQFKKFKERIIDKREDIHKIDLMGYLDLKHDHWDVMIFEGAIMAGTCCNNDEIEDFFKELNIPIEITNLWDESDNPTNWGDDED
jgi:hypothetical protein